jgi:hypothetical protein
MARPSSSTSLKGGRHLARRVAFLLALTAALAACGRRPDFLQLPPEPPPAGQQGEAEEGAPQ